ncbi:S41 family peptidase [Flavobacterium sp. LAR06]|uniref:S41 family peptidase n=1 Tax=Flavobacterium sp. LAR06 TaxID=3064897 RepID=UPI0035C12981
MNLRITLLIILLFGFHKIGAHTASGQGTDTYDIEKLSSLCKIWGFLKYYHPSVAKGTYNWDEQLIQLFPQVAEAKNQNELSNVYLKWIENLGEVKPCKSCINSSKEEYFDKNLDFSWLDNKNLFSEELSKKLKYIQNNRFQGENYYVTAGKSGNIQVKNELKYDNFNFPEQNYRLLSLFRYWNVVEYFYPYKYQTDENWNEVLKEMIPKFLNAGNEIQYHLAMLETVIKLDDSHANFYTVKIHDFFGRKYIPAYFNIIENKATITGFYNDSLARMNDLRIGDVIDKADGKDVDKIVIERKKYVSGSNSRTKAKNYDFFVLNGSADSLKLTVNRGGREIEKKVGRFDDKYFKNNTTMNGVKYRLLDHNIGYADMNFLQMADVDQMMLDFKSTKAIIIDYRKGMNFKPYLIARRLIQSEKAFARLIEPDLSYPGRFVWLKPETITPIKNKYYSGKIIVLVNENTQSASEYAAMILQTGDNVTTIGSTTAGADGDVSNVEFVGFRSFISGLGVFYPDGSETQRKGVKVDLDVYPTVKGLQEGKDEVLDSAVDFLKKSNKN